METNNYINAFEQTLEYMRRFGYDPYPERLHIAIPDAREQLMAGLQYYLGNEAQWLPCYDKVVEWLTDNKGRGLLCVGTCGLGKTLICQNILPMLIYRNTKKVPDTCTAIEMNGRIDALLNSKCVIVDDIGIEPVETNTYGNRRVPFNELCDQAERRGSLLIITTTQTQVFLSHPSKNATDNAPSTAFVPSPRSSSSRAQAYENKKFYTPAPKKRDCATLAQSRFFIYLSNCNDI